MTEKKYSKIEEVVQQGTNVDKDHTIEEYMERFGDDYNNGILWDFEDSDFWDGAIEYRKDIVYWLIDGRYYETTIPYDLDESKKKEKETFPAGDPEKNMTAFNHMMGSDCSGEGCEGTVCEAVMEDKVAAYNKALELAKKLNKEVVYGYTKGGKYYSVEPKEYHGDDKAFRSQYSANTILVAYPDKSFVKEKKEENLKEDISTEDLDKKFIDLLHEMDFELVKNDDGTYGLHDLQGANLGDIESEKFETAWDIMDRLSGAYINDYFLNLEGIDEFIKDEDYPEKGIWGVEDFYNWYTPEMKEKYPDLEYRGDICGFVLNGSEKVDLDKAYKYQEGEE